MIKICSANVRGLRQPLKRLDLWNRFKEMKADLVFLQETHLVEDDIEKLKKEWNISFYLSGTTTNSKGVAILINNTFEYNVLDITRDTDGRFLQITLDVANLYTITFVNVYGPNRDTPLWYKTLFSNTSNVDADYTVYVGDWNVCLKDIDFYNYNTLRNPKSNSVINENIEKLGLVDIWRLQNSETKKYTWGTKNPFKRARLDYFLINEDLLSLCPDAKIHSSYKSDHNVISLEINISKNEKGRGSWKLNSNLLENKELVTLINKEIQLIKQTYAIPVYEIESIDRQIDQSPIDSDLLKLELEEKNAALEELRDKRMRGYQVRSREEFIKGWEKPSKFFLNFRKKQLY